MEATTGKTDNLFYTIFPDSNYYVSRSSTITFTGFLILTYSKTIALSEIRKYLWWGIVHPTSLLLNSHDRGIPLQRAQPNITQNEPDKFAFSLELI